MSAEALIEGNGVACLFQRPIQHVSTTGSQHIQEWEDVLECFGWLQQVEGKNEHDNKQRGIQATHHLYCTTDPTITEGCRVLVEDQYYAILDVMNQCGLDRLWRVSVRHGS